MAQWEGSAKHTWVCEGDVFLARIACIPRQLPWPACIDVTSFLHRRLIHAHESGITIENRLEICIAEIEFVNKLLGDTTAWEEA
jgi:hypothetical protein